MITDQKRLILEELGFEYEHLRRSLKEADKKIGLLEAQASESEVLHANLLVEIEMARKVALISSSQLGPLESRHNQLKLERTNVIVELKLVEADLDTAKLRITVLEEEVVKSRSLVDALKEKWERSQERFWSLWKSCKAFKKSSTRFLHQLSQVTLVRDRAWTRGFF